MHMKNTSLCSLLTSGSVEYSFTLQLQSFFLRAQESCLNHVNLLFVCFTSKIPLQNRKLSCPNGKQGRENGWPALDTVVDIKGVAEDPPFRIAATCHSNKCSVCGSAVQKRQAGLWGLATSSQAAQMF